MGTYLTGSEKRRIKRETGDQKKQFNECLLETAKLFNRELDEDLVNVWGQLLEYCSPEEANRALKSWQFKGAYFPKPAEILQLVANERDSLRMKGSAPGCANCHDGFVVTNPDDSPADYIVRKCECVENSALRVSRIRRGLHSGYRWADIKWLMKHRMLDAGKPWTDEQWAALLDELDKKRAGGAPIWRRTHEQPAVDAERT